MNKIQSNLGTKYKEIETAEDILDFQVIHIENWERQVHQRNTVLLSLKGRIKLCGGQGAVCPQGFGK